MTESENIKEFLSGNRRELISVKKLETLAGLPQNTLRNFLNDQRPFPDHHLKSVMSFLVLIGYKPVSEDYDFCRTRHHHPNTIEG